MLPNMRPELILDQMKTLGDIHRESFPEIDNNARLSLSALEFESVHRVYAVGDGDSYHAALASEMAFNEYARIDYRPQSAMKFLEYSADYIPVAFPRDTLVVGISASGGSSRVVQSLERAKRVSNQIVTAGLVGNPDSRVANAADKVISVSIPELGRAPGIRTYAASLMGLTALAIRIGEIKRKLTMEKANALREEIVAMAEAVDETYRVSFEPAQKAADICKDAPFISYVGSGPSFGTAFFSGAKVVESAGIFSVAQDPEEWAHVERFCYPLDFPVFMIAPPGKGYWRSVELAKAVKLLGHPLIAVVEDGDKDVAQYADVVLPVMGKPAEPLSPLLYYVPGTTMAYFLTRHLGRSLFMTDNEKVMKVREEMNRQIRG